MSERAEIHKYSKTSVYFSGSSKLPQTNPVVETVDTVNIGLVINYKNGEIEDLASTLISDGATTFLKSVVCEFNLHKRDTEELYELIKTRYNGATQKSILVAIQVAIKRYFTWRELMRKNNIL